MIDTTQKTLLEIVRFQLFGGEKPQVDNNLTAAIMDEARAQTVTLTVFPFLSDKLKKHCPETFARANEMFYSNVMLNTNNFLEHDELHKLMTGNNVPYSAIKGLASAYYYPEPALRNMGDVDFLVNQPYFEKAKQAVLSAGFQIDHGEDDDDLHIAFKREPLSVWEQHRTVNGMPGGEAGVLISREIAKTVETSVTVTLDGATCKIPDTLHHGLIMLLHMIAHMTSEGIGLRHLCDWAVFAESLDSSEFAAVFEAKLKSFGLWKFAQIMTLTSEKYLGISKKDWAHGCSADGELLEDVISDILSGGNFGKKDLNRYREIKYISNRGERTVDSKGMASQVLSTLNQKVRKDHKVIGKYTALLPLGWVAEGGKYVGYLVSGRRKNTDTSKMLAEASKRKSIYSKMELFIGTDGRE